MDIEIFKEISVRARVAYAIYCMENGLVHYKLDRQDWEILIEQLWKITSEAYVDDWLYTTVEYRPWSVMEDLPFETKQYRFVHFELYQKLVELYGKSNDVINGIVDLIFETGTTEMYGDLGNFAPNSLLKLNEILDIMNENHIPLPHIDTFLKYRFSEKGGWGITFQREDIEKDHN